MTYEQIQRQLYNQRLKNEREKRAWEKSVILPHGNHSINMLPISNLFLGNPDYPPRIEMLVEDIKRINDDPYGAFFLGGNLFYYPTGKTEEKEMKVQILAEQLATILDRMDKSKVILAYDGINEESLKNDRILKWPIESTKILCEYLNISSRYFAGTKVELDFVFNNELTKHRNAIMSGIFTSIRPISPTRQAVINKFMKNVTMNRAKTFAIDTSSSIELEVEKINVAKLSNTLTQYREAYWISPAGYTDQPQKLRKDSLYCINNKVIQLKIEPQIKDLLPENPRTCDTTIDDDYKRIAMLLTIGVDFDRVYDPSICTELNKEIFLNEIYKESIIRELEAQFNANRNEQLTKIYRKKQESGETVSENQSDSKYTFE